MATVNISICSPAAPQPDLFLWEGHQAHPFEAALLGPAIASMVLTMCHSWAALPTT